MSVSEAGLNTRSVRSIGNADAGYPNGFNATSIVKLYHVGSDASEVGNGDLVTNGDFATDTDWTKGTGWTIAAGVASSDGTQVSVSDIEQDFEIVEGRSYVVAFEVTAFTAGTITPSLGGTDGTARGSAAVFSETIVAGSASATRLELQASADFVGSIDDVSVTPVDYYCGFDGFGFLKAIAYGGAAALGNDCALLDTSYGDAAPEDYPLADGVETLLGGLHESIELKSVGTGVRLLLG